MFPEAVENWYSNGLYPIISRTQRIALGWIPFSIGDILYASAIIYLIIKLVKLIKTVFRKQADKKFWIRGFRKLVFFMMVIFVMFYSFWGLNYSRLGIERSLQLPVQQYSKDDLLAVVDQLVIRLNELDSSARVDRKSLHRKKDLFGEAFDAYDSLRKLEPALTYRSRSVKPSIYSYLGNYLGFTGYYNPFTGEAQVNTTVPVFVQPFTTCHEIGHQLGYAKENEANFAGFLSARSSSDAAFRYSVYFDMYLYSRRYLYNIDSNLLKQYDLRLSKKVKDDYRELRLFWKQHENPIEQIVDVLYGQYLRANQQPSGKLTYSEVIAWLIAYYKKYGRDAV